MTGSVRIALDAMGGDNAPAEIVKGAIEGLKAYPQTKLLLVGKEAAIKAELAKYQYDKSKIEIVNATEIIDVNEHPAAAVKTKKNSSLVVATTLVKDGKADCVCSAGSTGALFVAGTMIVKRIRGIERTPLGTVIPTATGFSLIVDSGANVDAKPSQLVQYAQMGSIYLEKCYGVKKPRVALVNIGVEEEKGNEQAKATYPLLKECKDINFVGNIEAREIPNGGADVIVCDDFVGNVILKLYEGTAGALLKLVKEGMMSSVSGKIGGLLAKKSLKKSLKRFDASQYGGAPFLGMTGLVVKMHGSSKFKEVKAAIGQCYTFKAQNIPELIDEHIAAPAREALAKERTV